MSSHKRGCFFLFLLLITLLFSVSPVYSDGTIYGKKAGEISFAVESPFRISYIELANLLSISAGETVTPEKIKSSIDSLNKKLIFRRISVYGEREGETVSLVFVLEPFVPIESIIVRNARYFSGKEITSTLRLRRGNPVDSVDILKLRDMINAMYRDNGYFSANSDVKVACNLEGGDGEVLINVFEGKRPRLVEVEIRGNDNMTEEAILDILNLVRNQSLNLKKIENKMPKLLKNYKKKGFLLARIDDPIIGESPGGVSLSLTILEGEQFVVEFSGNKKYDSDKLMGVSGILSDIVTSSSGIVETLKEGVTSFYIDRGYPFVTVDVNLKEGEKIIYVQIEEGRRGVIGDIQFEGNSQIKDKELRGVMDTTVRGVFSFLTGGGILNEDELKNDLENIRGYYQSKGFPNARITVGKMEFAGGGKLELTIDVVEGERFIVREIKLKGVSFFTDREILQSLGNRSGKAINYVTAYANSWLIQKMYFDGGFDDCRISVSFTTKKETSEIDIIYNVTEGDRFVLGKVLVTGNSRVSSDVILRELPVKKGGILGESKLIDFQQRLYRTGLFRSVKTRKIKNYQTKEENLLIEVEEADALVLEGGAGYGTDTGYRGSLGVTHKNLNGRGRKISGELVISEKEFKLVTDLAEPWFLGIDVEGGINFTLQETEEVSFTFEQIALGGSLTRKFWERSSVSLQLQFSRENNKDVAPDAILSPEDVGKKSSILIRPILVLDHRDDPFNPQKGTFNSLFGELTPGIFPSVIPYVKVTAQSAWYVKFMKKTVLALSGRFGFAETIEGGQVPIDNRYFLGGSTTVRGFNLDRLGPIGDDGSPIGGDSMVNLNAELRYYAFGNFVLSLFLDGGSVWLRDIPEFDFDFRETGGYSIKYLTPAGFVSFDQGFKLDKRPGEPKSEIYFTIGAAF